MTSPLYTSTTRFYPPTGRCKDTNLFSFIQESIAGQARMLTVYLPICPIDQLLNQEVKITMTITTGPFESKV